MRGKALKTLSILGSTGSIGVQVLRLVRQFPDQFHVAGLAAGRNMDRLWEQILAFKPLCVSVASKREGQRLSQKGSPGFPLKILWGPEGHQAVATLPEADLVVSAMVGAVGLRPTLAAIGAGKVIGLANKESLVMAGELVMEEARKNKVSILPIDSEHSAIFQLLQGQQKKTLRRIILTASGGPFWNRPLRRMKKITGKEALNHPNWTMGPKITIDSATLMNKGLEVMEAGWLFQVSLDQVAVLIHPQSIVHSLVEFQDGSILAQMGLPDMTIPIAYALSYPKRLSLDEPALDLVQLSGLTFYQPDLKKFPCLKLALEAGKAGGSLPAVLNAANEIAVSAFLEGRLDFQDIPVVIQETLSGDIKIRPRNIEDILAVDHWARRQAKSWIRKHHH